MGTKIEDYLGGMHPRLIFLAISAQSALIGLFLVACGPKTSGPEAVVQQFYLELSDSGKTSGISGLPTETQMKRLRPVISLELDTLIETARHAQLHFLYAYPNEKPPWIEGNLFGSLFEGQHNFKLDEAAVKTSADGDTARVPVNLEYHDGKHTVRWTDEVVVVKYVEGWRVSDVRYKASWDFKPGSGLRDVLKSEL